MDPISLAIVGALARLSEQAIKDGYDALKALLGRKFGTESDLAKAVDGIEKKPDSDGRRVTLKEEVEAAKATQDHELMQAATALLDKIKSTPGGMQLIQTAIGDGNVQVAGNSNTVQFNTPKSS